MRLHGALALLLLLCIHVGHQGADARGDGFVRVQGTRFVLNGSPFFANGFNAYWLMSLGADPAQRGKVTSALSQAAGAGLTVARTWAFSDGGSNALQYSPGRYNENTFQGLDFVLSEARKHGIKMILSLVNSYDSFGGRKQYVQWAREQGQSIGSDDEFFTNPVVKGFYKNHIKFCSKTYGWDNLELKIMHCKYARMRMSTQAEGGNQHWRPAQNITAATNQLETLP